MQREQLLCWSGMTTDTEHTTSGSNEEAENAAQLAHCILLHA